jgi:hypothetical protein
MAVGVLDATQEWTALKRLQLSILADPLQQQQEALTVEYCACSILKGVPSLQQLRRLELTVPSLGASSAQHIMQLTQLTRLQLTASGASVDEAADLGAMSAMTNLVELHLNWALAPHLPAGLEGPYCLPSSLVELELSSRGHSSAAPMACWVAQLPGCPQLQHLVLDHGKQQHLSAHPRSVVGLLAQYNRQLRTLASPSSDDDMYWGAPVVGLPGAGGRFHTEWWPDAALATLTGLECLQSGRNAMLNIREQAQWQHLVQLTALRKLDGAMIWCVPELLPSSTLRLVKLVDCGALLGGYALGRLLLACPLLEQATIAVYAGSLPAQGARLPPHPKLVHLRLWQLTYWGEPEDCAALFAQLAPVLSGVSTLELHQWPLSDTRVTTFPDLSSCTALTALAFSSEEPYDNEWELPAEQEYFLSMVSPLKQLRRLEVSHAPRVNARVAFALQPMLPQLQHGELHHCGALLPAAVVEGGLCSKSRLCSSSSSSSSMMRSKP